jgi:hypothetical protein
MRTSYQFWLNEKKKIKRKMKLQYFLSGGISPWTLVESIDIDERLRRIKNNSLF